jgi:hypothetical protein
MIIGRSPRGAPNSAQSPGRLTAGARPEFHYVTSVQTVSSPWTSHVTLAARTCSPLIQTPPDGPVTCRVRGVGNLVLPLDCRELRHISPQGRAQLRNFCLTKRHEPGSQSRREGTDLSPVGSRPLVHGANHRSKHGQGVVEVGQGVGQFSQAEG